MEDLERWRGQIDGKLDAIGELQNRLDSDISRLEEIVESERHNYVTHDYYEQRHQTLEKAVQIGASRMSAIEGAQSSLARLLGLGIAIAGVTVAIVSIIVNHA